VLSKKKKKKNKEDEEKDDDGGGGGGGGGGDNDDDDGGGGGGDDDDKKDKLCCSIMSSEAPDIMVKGLTLMDCVQRSSIQTQKLNTLTKFFNCFLSITRISEQLTVSFNKLSSKVCSVSTEV
jgi:hypothetical protein